MQTARLHRNSGKTLFLSGAGLGGRGASTCQRQQRWGCPPSSERRRSGQYGHHHDATRKAFISGRRWPSPGLPVTRPIRDHRRQRALNQSVTTTSSRPGGFRRRHRRRSLGHHLDSTVAIANSPRRTEVGSTVTITTRRHTDLSRTGHHDQRRQPRLQRHVTITTFCRRRSSPTPMSSVGWRVRRRHRFAWRPAWSVARCDRPTVAT